MNLTLKVWRQKNSTAPGRFVEYPAKNIIPDMSFLEMLDVVNEDLIGRGEEPIAFDSDCREGICGTCSAVINGVPHGGHKGTTVCQLHMRHFKDGDHIVIEPWRASAFPVVRDLIVDRSAFDRIIQASGFISVSTGQATEANATPVPKVDRRPFHGCGCVHRMWRLRGRVQERFRNAVCGRQECPSRIAAPRSGRTLQPGVQYGESDGRGRLRQLHEHEFLRSGLSEGNLC